MMHGQKNIKSVKP